jgi:transcriptional regulator of acetoin/glycerol metabolism
LFQRHCAISGEAARRPSDGDTVTLDGTAGRTTARAREQFLSRPGEPDAQVRRMILASWIRSRDNNVGTDGLSVPYVRDPDLDAPLCRSAAPILDTLGTQLHGESVSIILTDHTGLVLDRRCSGNDLVGTLDEVRLAPGFSYAEQFAGTNGIGTALSTGGLTLVDGREHYSHELGRFACAGAPIKHPTRGKTVGVLDLTTWSDAPGAMLTALARATAKQIEDELLAQTGLREFALFADYMKTCQHSPGPVLALNNDVVMMNDHLRQLLDPAEQESLIGYAMDTMRGDDRTTARTVELPSGRSAHLRCKPVTCETGLAGGVFLIRLGQRPSRPRTGTLLSLVNQVGADLPGLVGAAPCWVHSCQQIDACYQAGDWVAVDGEPGVGKLALLRAVHRKHHPAVRFRVVEPPDPNGLEDWLSVLSEDLQLPNAAIVLAHVNGLNDDAAAAVAALLLEHAADRDPSTSPRLAMTLSGDPPAALRPLFPRTVEVPALRHHLEDLRLLVPHLLAQLTRGEHLECSPQALGQLARLNWPGNVAQLRAVLSQVVKHRRSGVIELDDLPPECRSATRRTLSQLEALERDAIVNALMISEANPTKAAASLGISRATIYRKLRTYGITLPLAH